MNSPNSRYAKRGPVVMPVEPPHNVLRALAGYPVILAVSDEMWARQIYRIVLDELKKRKRK